MTATMEKPRLLSKYEDEVKDKALKEFGLNNVSQVPKLSKVIINVGVGRFLDNQKLKPDIRDTVIATLTKISGQKPIEIKAKKSVSNFKVREGAPSSFMVTMRNNRMWHFFDRLVSLAIPRIKDFRGLNDKSFDAAGNYSMGLTEQAVWPEINMAEFSFNHGMNINLVFENSNAKMSRFVLENLGMPFKREEPAAEETPAEEAPAEEPAAEETPAEEAPAEEPAAEETPTEETPAEDSAETPVDEE